MAFLPTFFTVRVAAAPLPPPLLAALKQVEIETATGQASIFRLRFELSRTALGDWDVLQLDLFPPLAPLRIGVFLGQLPETIVNGYVQEARRHNRNQPGQSTLEVVGMDATSTLMNLEEKVKPWPNMPDSAIAAAIFGQYDLVPNTLPTPAARTVTQTTTIQRTSDIRFLKQLARRHSYECYVQPDPLLGIDTGYFGPPRSSLPPQAVLSVDFGIATNTENFNVRYDMLQPTTAQATALDPRSKAQLPGPAPAALEPPLGREPTLGRIQPPPVSRPAATDAANAGELLATSQSIANRSSRALRGSGEVDGLKLGRVLRPGLPIAVRGAGREHSGTYYVTQVSHTLSNDKYTQHFDAWRNAVGLSGAELFVDPFAAL
jgi:Phage tail baseplate hub (GPD)